MTSAWRYWVPMIRAVLNREGGNEAQMSPNRLWTHFLHDPMWIVPDANFLHGTSPRSVGTDRLHLGGGGSEWTGLHGGNFHAGSRLPRISGPVDDGFTLFSSHDKVRLSESFDHFIPRCVADRNPTALVGDTSAGADEPKRAQ